MFYGCPSRTVADTIAREHPIDPLSPPAPTELRVEISVAMVTATMVYLHRGKFSHGVGLAAQINFNAVPCKLASAQMVLI